MFVLFSYFFRNAALSTSSGTSFSRTSPILPTASSSAFGAAIFHVPPLPSFTVLSRALPRLHARTLRPSATKSSARISSTSTSPFANPAESTSATLRRPAVARTVRISSTDGLAPSTNLCLTTSEMTPRRFLPNFSTVIAMDGNSELKTAIASISSTMLLSTPRTL